MRSAEKDLEKEPDFGTYHHTTPAESKKIRAAAKTTFKHAYASLPFGRDDRLKILDVGCGLGFLSCISAEFYENARITGIDTFKHASLKGSSLKNAEENAKILGFSDRIDFKKSNVFRFRPVETFDIIVSNLVFHNLGRRRFEAYSRLSSWARAGGYIVIGDLFPSPEIDLARLSKMFRVVRKVKPKIGSRQYMILVASNDLSRSV
jgi:cyclopropane fatty-acyl-phospholipid synthase-like methyltransferase